MDYKMLDQLLLIFYIQMSRREDISK